jgi:polar amino acid transport system ATP-binding protein
MLKIRDAYKAFNHTKVLENINLDIKKSSILGIAGPSGCGKSTLLRCIQKLEPIDGGTIEYGGRTGFMFQDFHLFPHMTVPLLRKKLFDRFENNGKDEWHGVEASDTQKSSGHLSANLGNVSIRRHGIKMLPADHFGEFRFPARFRTMGCVLLIRQLLP